MSEHLIYLLKMLAWNDFSESYHLSKRFFCPGENC